jgi:hypothetical protein
MSSCARRAGVMSSSVAWRALRRSPPLASGARLAPAAAPPRAQFIAYGHHFTDMTTWALDTPAVGGGVAAGGARVLRCLQARHDHVIALQEGKNLYASLVALHAARRSAGEPRHETFEEIDGGHVWGFLSANALLSGAVVGALAQLAELQRGVEVQ